MARKRYTAEEIIGQLRTIEIELGKGLAVVEACGNWGVLRGHSPIVTDVRTSEVLLR